MRSTGSYQEDRCRGCCCFLVVTVSQPLVVSGLANTCQGPFFAYNDSTPSQIGNIRQNYVQVTLVWRGKPRPKQPAKEGIFSHREQTRCRADSASTISPIMLWSSNNCLWLIAQIDDDSLWQHRSWDMISPICFDYLTRAKFLWKLLDLKRLTRRRKTIYLHPHCCWATQTNCYWHALIILSNLLIARQDK